MRFFSPSPAGKTWSASKDVSKDWGAASGSLPGPGNGVQTTTGRLLVAAHHSAYVHDFIVWSDDEGCEKRHLFLSAFPMFVPSLSWQNDRSYI